MDKTTHALYTRCVEYPEAHRKLQRLTSIRARVAFVQAHYRLLYDHELVHAQRPFAYRVGQWYTKRLQLTVHLDTVHLYANFQVTARIDDGRYVDREQTLVNERRVPPHHVAERVELAVASCLETFDGDVWMSGVESLTETKRVALRQDAVCAVQTALDTTLNEMKRTNHAMVDHASGHRMPADVHDVVDAFLYGPTPAASNSRKESDSTA